MTSAFMVVTGEYSYYHVVAVCLDKAEAESLAAWLGNTGGYGTDAHEVEEIDLGDGWRTNRTEVLNLFADIDPDGNVSYRENFDRWIGEPGNNQYAGPCKVNVHPCSATNYQKEGVGVHVFGTDHERVRKVFSEQVAIAKADYAVLIEADRLLLIEREAKYEQWKLDNPFVVSETSQSYYTIAELIHPKTEIT